MDEVNEKVGSPCVKTSGWGFIGVVVQGKKESRVGIGTFSMYCDGRAAANAWLNATPNADRWIASPLYEEIQENG